jgi:hypothetical protein
MRLNEFQMDMQLKLQELVQDVTRKLQQADVEISNVSQIKNFCNDNFDLLVGVAKTIEPEILASNFRKYAMPEGEDNSLIEKILREAKR